MDKHAESNFSLVETQVNREGNETEVLFARLRDPAIKAQMAELAYQNAQDFYLKNNTKIFPFTRDEIAADIERRIAEAERVTNISFSSDEPDDRTMHLNYCFPGTKERLSAGQKSIIEAHEKGHNVRYYNWDFFRDRFAAGFDPSMVVFGEKEYAEERTSKPWATFDEAKESFFRYLFSGNETAERMSQLKNYFGMKGSEEFTREHLEYARIHYVADTGTDNRMSPFLLAVIPETEDAFLRLINSMGI